MVRMYTTILSVFTIKYYNKAMATQNWRGFLDPALIPHIYDIIYDCHNNENTTTIHTYIGSTN